MDSKETSVDCRQADNNKTQKKTTKVQIQIYRKHAFARSIRRQQQ